MSDSLSAFGPKLTDDQELLLHMLDQRTVYKALAKQATTIANKVRARTVYNERYANDLEFRQREKQRMLSAYYLKKEGMAATTATIN